MGYHALVTVILALHFTYLAYVVLGGFLAWRWPYAIWPHLVALGWGILIVLGLVNCPLTWAEDWARRHAGEAPLTSGFVDRYLENVIYPPRYVNEARALVALVVLVSWIGVYLKWRSRAARRAAERASQQGKSPVAH